MRGFVAAIILGSGLLPIACGPAEPEFTLAAASDGRTFKLEGISEVTRPSGVAALLLSYRTDLDLADRRAMESEVAVIWETLRPEVESRGLRVAVIRASQWEQPRWERRGRASQYVVERSTDGRWDARPDETATSAPDPPRKREP